MYILNKFIYFKTDIIYYKIYNYVEVNSWQLLKMMVIGMVQSETDLNTMTLKPIRTGSGILLLVNLHVESRVLLIRM